MIFQVEVGLRETTSSENQSRSPEVKQVIIISRDQRNIDQRFETKVEGESFTEDR